MQKLLLSCYSIQNMALNSTVASPVAVELPTSSISRICGGISSGVAFLRSFFFFLLFGGITARKHQWSTGPLYIALPFSTCDLAPSGYVQDWMGTPPAVNRRKQNSTTAVDSRTPKCCRNWCSSTRTWDKTVFILWQVFSMTSMCSRSLVSYMARVIFTSSSVPQFFNYRKQNIWSN